MLKVLIDTVIQSNAEIAAEQEHALAATTDLANSRLTGVNVLAEETYTTMNRLNSAIVSENVCPRRSFLMSNRINLCQE